MWGILYMYHSCIWDRRNGKESMFVASYWRRKWRCLSLSLSLQHTLSIFVLSVDFSHFFSRLIRYNSSLAVKSQTPCAHATYICIRHTIRWKLRPSARNSEILSRLSIILLSALFYSLRVLTTISMEQLPTITSLNMDCAATTIWYYESVTSCHSWHQRQLLICYTFNC